VTIRRLVVASKNSDKVKEVEEILEALGVVEEVVQGLDWPDIEETGQSLEENALLKARAVAAATRLPALADDTGLEVEALDGRPGVMTARLAGPQATYAENVTALLAELGSRTDRAAVFRTVVALVDPGGEATVAEGSLRGWIANEPRGDNGFGYDPVFVVEGRRLAEMSSEEKHALSHRARALRALAAKLS